MRVTISKPIYIISIKYTTNNRNRLLLSLIHSHNWNKENLVLIWLEKRKKLNSDTRRHFTCSSLKPLFRRCTSKDLTMLLNCCCALGNPEADLLFSSFFSLMVTCPLRDAEDLLSAARKPEDSNSVQKIAATIPVKRTNRDKMRIMLAAVHSILNVR